MTYRREGSVILLENAGGQIVFHYPVADALRGAVPLEGQRLAFMRLGDLDQQPVVPRHRDILEWYERHKATLANQESK